MLLAVFGLTAIINRAIPDDDATITCRGLTLTLTLTLTLIIMQGSLAVERQYPAYGSRWMQAKSSTNPNPNLSSNSNPIPNPNCSVYIFLCRFLRTREPQALVDSLERSEG